MGKTVELRKVIQSELKSVANIVYYGRADDDTAFPYVVFRFNTVNSSDSVVLVVDVWDKNSDETEIENLTDNIEMLFDNTCNNYISTVTICHLENRNDIEDEDKSIKRRQLRFTLQNNYKGIETVAFVTNTAQKIYVIKEE